MQCYPLSLDQISRLQRHAVITLMYIHHLSSQSERVLSEQAADALQTFKDEKDWVALVHFCSGQV